MNTHLSSLPFLAAPSVSAAALVLAALGVFPGAVLPRAAAPPTFHVHVLPVLAGQVAGFPTSMSRDGVIVGQCGSDPFDPTDQPVAISLTRSLLLAKPNDSLNFAIGIGTSSLVAGTSATMPVAWQEGVPQLLAPVGGLVNGSANDANAHGVLCGTLYNDFTGHQIAVVWPGAQSNGAELPVGSASDGAANGINDRGWVAGSVQGGAVGNFQAARWEDPTQPPALLGVLNGAMNSEALAINEHGDTAGRSSFPDFSTEAFLHVRRTGALVPLGHLGGTYSSASAVNASRQVVGTASTAGGEAHAFLWHQGTLYDLNALIQSSSQPILYLSNAVAILDDGRIAAEAIVASPNGPVSKMALLQP